MALRSVHDAKSQLAQSLNRVQDLSVRIAEQEATTYTSEVAGLRGPIEMVCNAQSKGIVENS